jgi:hypothetical protein
MRKKAISLLLSFSLILGSTGVVSLASDIVLPEDDIDDIDIVMEDSDDSSDSSDSSDASAFEASTQDYSIYDQLPQGDYRVEGMNEVENPDLSEEVDEGYLSKSRYSWSKSPLITNQGNYAMDWACSTIAVAGMNGCKQLNYSGSIYFSELHLAYFSYNHVTNAPGEISEDINEAIYSDKYHNFLQRGGNRIFASNILASWKGLASGTLYPYSKAETVLSEGLSTADCNNQASYVEDFYEVNISSAPEDIKAVKKLIYNTGAVGASFYADSYYYNPEHASYLSNVNETNHAIVLVGWDDDFSANNFNTPAMGDGAWIA